MDDDQIRERFLQSRRDDRGPVEKFLDLIDMPRNQIAAIMAPGLERAARERGETGAFGTGRVFASDALQAAGINNRVARAVLGFGLDVAIDPLTYLGPAGWGFKATNVAGQGVRVGLRGRHALTGSKLLRKEGAFREMARGGIEAVSDPLAKDLIRSSGATTAAEASAKILGSPTGGKVSQLLSRVGGEQGKAGGILAEGFDKFGLTGPAAQQAEAARGFVKQYGKGSAPGVRIGRDATGKLRITVGKAASDGPVATSTIAHIPFTEWGIHVPAFTADGKASADALRIASSTGRVDPVRAAGPGVAAAEAIVREIQRHTDTVNHLAKVDPNSTEAALFAGTEGASLESISALRNRLDNLFGGPGAPAIPAAEPENIGELLAMRRLIDEGESAAEAARAAAEHLAAGRGPDMTPGRAERAYDALAIAKQRYADAVRGSVKQFASTQDEATQRIVKRMLGTDDDIIGASVLTPMRTAASAAGDPGVVTDILNRVDKAGRNLFGQPGGMLRSQARYLRNTLTTGSRELFNATERSIRGDILKAMDDAGLTARTTDDYRNAANLTFAHMYALRNAQALADGAEPVFYTTKFGSTEPAEWVELLQKAQADGFFSQRPTGSLADNLRGVAERYVHALDTLGSEEYADNILGATLKGYVPTVATPAAKARIRSIKDYQLVKDRGGVAAARGLEKESFQKPRSTFQYRFKDEDGRARRFFEKDKWVKTVTPRELEAIRLEDKAAAARISELQDTIEQYEKLAKDKKWAAANAGRNTDPWELNQLVNDGHFSLLVGADEIPGGFADTNIATAMASRFMSHERAVARRTWLEYAKQFGVTVNPGQMQGKLKDGQTFVLKDGSVAKFFRDERSGQWGFEQMGERYRPLSSAVASLKNNPLMEAMGDTAAKVYHEDVARMIEDLANLYEQDPGGLLGTMDRIAGVWKTSTLMSPTWTIGNIIGDGLNYLMGGARAADMARNAPTVARIIANADNPEALRGLSISIRGVDVPAEQFVNDLRTNRLLGTNKHAETALQLINRKFFTMPSQVRGVEGRGASGAINRLRADFAPANLKADFLQRLSHETAASKATGVARATGFVARDRLMRRVIAPWFRANEKVSDYMRALAYSSFLEQGNDIPAAVQRTIRSGFDYADNTRVERTYFRRMFPFYSWMRLNGAYQMKLLMERPIYAGSFPLLQNAIEEAMAGDQRVPLHARPAWMRNQLAVMVGSDPEERFAVMLGNTLPTEQALMAGGALTGIDGVQQFAKYFLTGLSPVVRAPAEFAAGREFFTGKTIASDGDTTPGQFLQQQFRPLNESRKIAATVGQQGAGAGLARFALGGRVQNASDERLHTARIREFQEEERKFQTAVRRADRNQDAAARAVAGARLLQLYQAMLQAGFEAEVPAWARERLAAMASG